jgi:hypothetical protein
MSRPASAEELDEIDSLVRKLRGESGPKGEAEDDA